MPSESPLPRSREETTSRRRKRGTPRLLKTAISLLVAGTSLAGLGVGAVHALRGTVALSASHQVALWTLDDKYWSCLETQAHSLVKPGERVWMDTTSLTTLLTLERIFGTSVTFVDTAEQAEALVNVRASDGSGACLGSVVVASSRGPRAAGSVWRTGSGASLAGNPQELPSTPL
jgi:hypothetical protein